MRLYHTCSPMVVLTVGGACGEAQPRRLLLLIVLKSELLILSLLMLLTSQVLVVCFSSVTPMVMQVTGVDAGAGVVDQCRCH